MAVLFSSSSQGSVESTGLTFSHVVGSNANRLLLVSVISDVGHPSGITYNGVAMTSINSATRYSMYHSVWALRNPSSGTNNVVVSWSGTRAVSAIANSYYGADQSADPAVSAAVGTGTAGAVSHTVVNDGSMGQHTVGNSESEAVTPGSGQTETQETGEPSIETSFKAFNAGSQTMTGTWANSWSWRATFVEIAPAASGGAVPRVMFNYRQRRIP